MSEPFRPRHTPSRVLLARMRRGLQCWQVADSTGIDRRRMNDIEKGRCLATEDEIDRIAERLRFPAPFFYRPHVEFPDW